MAVYLFDHAEHTRLSPLLGFTIPLPTTNLNPADPEQHRDHSATEGSSK
jgi:hypothetical protein